MKRASLASGGAALVVAWGEADPGGELARVAELGEIRQLSEDDLDGGFAKAGDGVEEVAFGLKGGVGFENFPDEEACCLDLFFLCFDAAVKGGCDALFGCGFEPCLEPGVVTGDGVGVASELGDPLLDGAPGVPGVEIRVLDLRKAAMSRASAVSLLLRRSFCFP